MRNTGPITVRKLHPLFGAEISGIDITRPLSAREFGPIRAAFEEHSVLLFRDQPMDDEKQIAFSELFGPLETTGSDVRRPSFVIARDSETAGVRFAGLPRHMFRRTELAIRS